METITVSKWYINEEYNAFLFEFNNCKVTDELDEYHTAVGFICDGVGYMKECGIEEEELIGHIRATYKAHPPEETIKN